jgi:hypothetical protein
MVGAGVVFIQCAVGATTAEYRYRFCTGAIYLVVLSHEDGGAASRMDSYLVYVLKRLYDD